MLRRLLLSTAGAEEPRRATMAKGGVSGSERAHDVRCERPERPGLVPTGATHPKSASFLRPIFQNHSHSRPAKQRQSAQPSN